MGAKTIREIMNEGNDQKNSSAETSDKNRDVLVKHRTAQEIAEDEDITISIIPNLILWLLAIFTILTTITSTVVYHFKFENNFIYGITGLLYGFVAMVLIELKIVSQPHEYVITFLGRFYALWKPGPHLLIPGILKIKSKVNVFTDIPLKLFRDEESPILIEDTVPILPDVTVILRVHDPYGVSFDLTPHENFIESLKKIGIIYKEDESYLYGLEEILDSLIRRHLSPLSVEEVLTLNTKDNDILAFNTDIIKQIEKKADARLKRYGVDLVLTLFAEIHITDEAVNKKLLAKFHAKQDKEIADLQEQVEVSNVKVRTQKALQTKEDGKGEGSFDEEQLIKLKSQGLTVKEAVKRLNTKSWTDAVKEGANVQLVSMGTDGNMSMPVTTGIGMSIGQDMANKKQTKDNKKGEQSIEEEQEQND